MKPYHKINTKLSWTEVLMMLKAILAQRQIYSVGRQIDCFNNGTKI